LKKINEKKHRFDIYRQYKLKLKKILAFQLRVSFIGRKVTCDKIGNITSQHGFYRKFSEHLGSFWG
jgi:hypothetical protein